MAILKKFVLLYFAELISLSFGPLHFTPWTKDVNGRVIKIRLIRILDHCAIKHRLFLFAFTEEFPTAADHLIDAIQSFLIFRYLRQALLRKMYFEMVNCKREIKNRYLFGYLEGLLAWYDFDVIGVWYLSIGHTHEDIDQTFPFASRRLEVINVVTLFKLHPQLSASYNDLITSSPIASVANIYRLL